MRAALFAAGRHGAAGVLAGLVPALKLARADVSDTLRQQTRGASSGHRLMRALVDRRGGAGVGAAGQRRTDGGQPAAAARRQSRPAGRRRSTRSRCRCRRATTPRSGACSWCGSCTKRPARSRASSGPGSRRGIRSAAAASARRSKPRISRWRPGQSGAHRQPSPGHARLDDHGRRDVAAGAALHRRRQAGARRWRSSAGASPSGCGRAKTRSASACGRRGPNEPWITVVGVAGDVRDSGTWAETWYVPYEQHAATLAGGTVHLMVRSHGRRRRRRRRAASGDRRHRSAAAGARAVGDDHAVARRADAAADGRRWCPRCSA